MCYNIKYEIDFRRSPLSSSVFKGKTMLYFFFIFFAPEPAYKQLSNMLKKSKSFVKLTLNDLSGALKPTTLSII